MSELKVKRCKPISIELRVPGDKSISHRAAMMAALSNGPCVIDGFLPSEDCLCTVEAMRKLGARVQILDDNKERPTKLKITGRRGVFQSPDSPIDCGNSGTTMRLLSGLLAGQPEGFRAELIGDASLTKRPMKRVLEPLALMGADIDAQGEGDTAPLLIRGVKSLKPLDYQLPVASAQVKSCILLAALSTKGGERTTVTEPTRTRDHTERMLHHFQVKTLKEDDRISIWGGQCLESQDFTVPGDISSAAFWVVAAAAMPGAHLSVRGVGLNETRTGVLKALIRMGAQISEVQDTQCGEPVGTIEVHGTKLKGTVIEGEDIANVIDEIPILAVAAALAEGRTIIRDAKELRVKESDRIMAVAQNLQLMGVDVQEFFDGMEIKGGSPLKGATLRSHGDHRIAMSFAIAGLFAQGETTIEDVDCIDTSYPGFAEQIRAIISGRPEAHIPVISSIHPKVDLNKDKQPKPQAD